MEQTSSPTYFGGWIKHRRKMLDLTQVGLAQRSGCSLPALRKIEAGERRPSRQLADLLARSLEIPIDDRATFIKVARGEMSIERLSDPAYTSPDSFRETQSSFHTHGNLPEMLTSFIGRETEIQWLQQKLLDDAHRLITLTGAGGTGKTRLALQVCAKLNDTFSDGVWLVELASINDPGLVVKSVAQVLGMHESPGIFLLDTISAYLRHRRLLLLIDNCEHLLEACGRLVQHLLNECPRLTILTTSREALNISGETAYRVPSLDVPDRQAVSSLEDLAQVESVRLFAERAAAVLPDFRLSPETISAAVHLCQRLDGIPLAIELAAARVIVLSVNEIASHLDDRFNLLTGGSRTALPRQQTLQASIDWSYNLLSPKECLLMQRLSVFSGGWNLPAAVAVCVGEGLEAWEILDALTGLVAKSLVIADHRSGVETRYRMLETIRQYAQERLEDAGKETIIQDRHLAYFVRLSEAHGPLLRTLDIYDLLERLDLELDNLRGALSFALNIRDRSGAEQALRILSSLFYFWWLRKLISETDDWMQRAIKLLPVNDPQSASLKAWSLLELAQLKNRFGYFIREQLEHLDVSITLFQQAGDMPGNRLKLALALATRMDAVNRFLWFFPPESSYQRESAQKDGEESLLLAQEFLNTVNSESRWVTAWIYLLHAESGDYTAEPDRVVRFTQLAHEISRSLGDQVVELKIQMLLSNFYIFKDLDKSAMYARQGITLATRLGDKRSIGFFYERLGLLAYRFNKFEDMEDYFCEAETIFRLSAPANPLWGETWITRMKGVAAVNQPNAEKARYYLSTALNMAIKNGDPNGVLSAIIHYAGLSILCGQYPEAARLLGFIERQYEAWFKEMDHLPDRDEFKKHTDHVKKALGDADFTALWIKGQSMTTEQAIMLVRASS